MRMGRQPNKTEEPAIVYDRRLFFFSPAPSKIKAKRQGFQRIKKPRMGNPVFHPSVLSVLLTIQFFASCANFSGSGH
jgi:hypothetical protein